MPAGALRAAGCRPRLQAATGHARPERCRTASAARARCPAAPPARSSRPGTAHPGRLGARCACLRPQRSEHRQAEQRRRRIDIARGRRERQRHEQRRSRVRASAGGLPSFLSRSRSCPRRVPEQRAIASRAAGTAAVRGSISPGALRWPRAWSSAGGASMCAAAARLFQNSVRSAPAPRGRATLSTQGAISSACSAKPAYSSRGAVPPSVAAHDEAPGPVPVRANPGRSWP